MGRLLFSKLIYYQTIILNKMGEQYKIIEYSLIILFIVILEKPLRVRAGSGLGGGPERGQPQAGLPQPGRRVHGEPPRPDPPAEAAGAAYGAEVLRA